MSLMNTFPKYMPYSIKIKTSFTKTSGIIHVRRKCQIFSLVNSQVIKKDQKIISIYDTNWYREDLA